MSDLTLEPWSARRPETTRVLRAGTTLGSIMRAPGGDWLISSAFYSNGREHVAACTMEQAAVELVRLHERLADEHRRRRQAGVIHIDRPALPWHTTRDRVTLCGRPKVNHRVATAGDIADADKARTCGQCKQIVPYYRPWEDDPAALLRSWLDDSNRERRDRLRSQLVALALTATTHPDTYETELAMLALAGKDLT